ncbi:UDP-N-acetylmuramoyl-L-alanyl-D-glutamate--2,6-diaminopimelate ligase [Halobacillus shinanisalinarum]|uniref:UDP-N-acetylmuramyl-tripeptide synthetase n=1 Tax=Halobacillus shinanisalinarum TaxID=2932258 RepID=A0ABY4GUU3_9BACI|nr:UDP-N-acetylmuramoyl-L-alanyl-D-glutamate--2,6-diaminopimelate ligase [Halobacillus shinanisalinarum]UOQ91668.1 UDP-N-acetylmuramoyl-L-alanyl-D-glutamate--2,6-diaminopimelate ligase [Halobacillus shinanisalinarum]
MTKTTIHFTHCLKECSLEGPSEQKVSSIIYDSREALDGAVFVCIKGTHHDGHLYIEQALTYGAKAIVGTNSALLHSYARLHSDVSFITVNDSKEALALLSTAFYNHPAQSLSTVGVTGTNGKTTVTSFIYSMLNCLSYRTGSIGTAGIWTDQERTNFKQTVPTTPESPDIHYVLDHFQKVGIQGVVLESTSIALEQKRLAGINFNVAVHTNLTPEHLEFHETMQDYRKAKLKLFKQAEYAVVNIDDPGMAREIVETFNGPLLTYGTEKEADFGADDIRVSVHGSTFTLHACGEIHSVSVPVHGKYNVSNILAAMAACYQLGFSLKHILSVVTKVKSPEGRFQIVNNDAPFQIVLDYAHTPDALSHVLQAVRQVPYNKLIVMITGIGLRDPGKRPQMAKEVEGIADEVIVSVDQPGFADRQEVINDVLQGFTNPNSNHIHSLLHREQAIHYAFDLASDGDLVLLTGIGFGGYQIIGDEKVPYSEHEVIKQYFSSNESLIQSV